MFHILLSVVIIRSKNNVFIHTFQSEKNYFLGLKRFKKAGLPVNSAKFGYAEKLRLDFQGEPNRNYSNKIKGFHHPLLKTLKTAAKKKVC